MDALNEAHLATRIIDSLHVMLDCQLTRAEGFVAAVPKVVDGSVVTVPLIGSPNYLLTLCASDEGALRLACAMFGCSRNLASQMMIDDALCESANLVAGQVKHLMAKEHQIGVPSMLTSDSTLAGAQPVVGARLNLGDPGAHIDIVVVDLDAATATTRRVASEQAQCATVLLAEDDEITLAFLKTIVQSTGLRIVAQCQDGTQALREFQRLKPDITCLDINMPGLNGLQVLTEIRRANPQAIVFLVSAFATADNVREAIQLKPNGIIVKPFVKARIVAEIQRALAQKQGATAATAAASGR